MLAALNNAHALMISVVRLGRGLIAKPGPVPLPDQPLTLYEFEACPYCRKVREVMSELDLSFLCIPCARGSRHRAELVKRAGKAQFPYLIDPNTGVEMYESEDIITYLMQTYGASRSALSRVVSPLNSLGSTAASGLRPLGRRVASGLDARPSPDEPLILYGFEASPYCRKAREWLAHLDLPYEMRNVAKGGRRRSELEKRGGKMQVPFLIDPNTGAEMYESEDIIRYLKDRYGPRDEH